RAAVDRSRGTRHCSGSTVNNGTPTRCGPLLPAALSTPGAAAICQFPVLRSASLPARFPPWRAPSAAPIAPPPPPCLPTELSRYSPRPRSGFVLRSRPGLGTLLLESRLPLRFAGQGLDTQKTPP